MSSTILFSTTLDTLTCGVCHIPFAIPESMLEKLKQNGQVFHCPNGHEISYGSSENKRLKARLEERERELTQAKCALINERAEHEKKMKVVCRRAHAGVCPYCNRTFKQVTKHIASKHPGNKIP